ncbi:hypothetical protein CPC08DRAFT_197909 [Agrocybe pediades]|nr:hypothetical protein CPC08DRAFT_197909 [Agrocybe pediades]
MRRSSTQIPTRPWYSFEEHVLATPYRSSPSRLELPKRDAFQTKPHEKVSTCLPAECGFIETKSAKTNTIAEVRRFTSECRKRRMGGRGCGKHHRAHNRRRRACHSAHRQTWASRRRPCHREDPQRNVTKEQSIPGVEAKGVVEKFRRY